MKEEYARYLLKKTIQDYNLIAGQFSSTRRYFWPELNFLSGFAKPGEKVLDLGCGNGRLLSLFEDRDVEYVGADASKEMIRIAAKRHPGAEFQVADAFNLPFPDKDFDKIFSIAVLHHIPSKEFRIEFLKEAKRILKPDSLLILTVWDLWRKPKTLKLIAKFALLKILSRSKLDFKDVFAPWQKKVRRYIHCFTEKELRRLAERAGFRVAASGLIGKNIYLIARS